MVFCKDLKSGPIFEWVRSISQTRVGHFMIITQRNILGKETICCEKSMKSRESHLLKRKSEIQANSVRNVSQIGSLNKWSKNLTFYHLTIQRPWLDKYSADAYTRILILFEQEATVIIYYLFVIACIFPITFWIMKVSTEQYSGKFLLQERLKIYTFVNKIIWTYVTHHVIYMSFVSFKFLFFLSLRLRFYVHI